jgi:hypothetical protein
MFLKLKNSNLFINSFRKSIAKLADSCSHITDLASKNRYAILCRNIRAYSIQTLQNYAISTKRVPSEEDTKRALDERIARLALNIPGMNRNSGEIPKELEPFVQQYYQITQFIERAKLAGRDDEVRLLELNLREIERELSVVK